MPTAEIRHVCLAKWASPKFSLKFSVLLLCRTGNLINLVFIFHTGLPEIRISLLEPNLSKKGFPFEKKKKKEKVETVLGSHLNPFSDECSLSPNALNANSTAPPLGLT